MKKLRLVLILLTTLFTSLTLRAATLTVSPPAVTNDYSGVITLTISGLSAGQSVRVERFADFAGNKAIGTDDLLVHRFTVTDGQQAIIGGVRNSNVADDNDGAANQTIVTRIPFRGVDTTLGTAAGEFIYRVSDANTGAVLATASFSVRSKVLAGGVTGHVLNAAGQPIANSFVFVINPNGPGGQGVLTDTSGAFVLYAAPGTYSLLAVKKGFISDTSAGTVTISSSSVLRNVTLQPGTIHVTGSIIDSGTSAGIGGVFMQAETSAGLFTGGFADASGQYDLALSAGNWKIRPEKDQLAELGYVASNDDAQTNITAAVSGLNFSATRATALIYGTLVDTLNNRLASVGIRGETQNDNQLTAAGRTSSASAGTPAGDYVLGVVAGNWSVSPQSDELSLLGYSSQNSNATVTAGSAVRVDLVARRFSSHILGRVLDNNNNPVANILVLAMPNEGGGQNQATTDANGNFDLGVYGGGWMLELESSSADNANVIGASTNVTVADNASLSNVVVQVRATTATISGTVRDGSNNPVANVGVYAYPPGSPFNSYNKTDSAGHYSLRVFFGGWQVGLDSFDLSDRGFGPAIEQTAGVTSSSTILNFTVSPAVTHLRGSVINDSNALLPGVQVNALLQGGGNLQTTTDGNGAFDFVVTGGNWTLSISPSSATALGLLSPSINVAVTAGVDQNNQVVIARQSTAAINGYLCDTANNNIAGITIYATTTLNGATYTSTATTAANGTFSLPAFNANWAVTVDCASLQLRGYTCPTNAYVSLTGGNANLAFTVATAVTGPALSISNPSLPSGTVGSNYSCRILGAGGTTPYTWSISSGSLPGGLSINSTTGFITGNPTASGPFNFTVHVADSASSTAEKSFSLYIGTGTASDADITFYSITKGQSFVQTSADAPALVTDQAPFRFQASLSGPGAANAAGIISAPGPNIHPLSVNDGELRFQEEFTSQTALDAAYASGTYTLNFSTARNGNKLINLTLPATAFPSTPHLKNFAATQAIIPSTAFALSWDAFASGGVNDFIQVQVETTDGQTVFQTPEYKTTGALTGTSTAATIPANTLSSGQSYRLRLFFAKVATANTSAYPGALGVAGFSSRTTVTLQTTGGAPVGPSVVVTPGSETVTAGATVTLHAVPSGTPPFYLGWQHNGNPIQNATNSTFTFRASPETAGDYNIQVSNAGGTIYSDAIHITVNPETVKPTVTLLTPAAGARLTNPMVTITGRATDNVSLSQVLVQVNAGGFFAATGLSNWTAQAELAPGPNVIQVKSIDSSGNESIVASRTVTYVQMAPLTVTINGTGTVSPNLNGKLLEVGKSNRVVAVPGAGFLFLNWSGGVDSTNPVINFAMQQGLAIQANFIPNPFIPAKGVYNGLFYADTGVLLESSGFITFTVGTPADASTYSGHLTMGSQILPFSGRLAINGSSGVGSAQITRTGKTPLTVTVAVDLAAGNMASGHVTDGTFVSGFQAFRSAFSTAHPSAQAGKYTMVIPGNGAAGQPLGNGALALTITPLGAIQVSGNLADGSTVTPAGTINPQGQWPFYASLYGGRGAIMGWLNFAGSPGSAVDGSVAWIKSATAGGKYYPAGFTNVANVVGSTLSNSAPMITLSNAFILMTGGNLTTPIYQPVTISNAGVISVAGTNGFHLTLSTTSGLISGTFTDPVRRTTDIIRAVILQQQNLIRGYFLGADQSGALEIH